MFHCILFVVIINEFPLAGQSKRNLILRRQSEHNGDMFSKSRCFPQSTTFTDDYPILAPKPFGFSQELLQTQAQSKYETNDKYKFHQFLMYRTYKKN